MQQVYGYILRRALAVFIQIIFQLFSTLNTCTSCTITNKSYTEASNIVHLYIFSENMVRCSMEFIYKW